MDDNKAGEEQFRKGTIDNYVELGFDMDKAVMAVECGMEAFRKAMDVALEHCSLLKEDEEAELLAMTALGYSMRLWATRSGQGLLELALAKCVEDGKDPQKLLDIILEKGAR